MYLPKSQIVENQFTNGGEFVRSDNGESYKGFYWEDSSGKYYSGKTPSDLPSVQLFLDSTDSTEDPGPFNNRSSWTTDFNNQITSKTPGVSPSKNIPLPTEENYKIGEFQRYFTKKANQNIYFEISEKDFRRLSSKDDIIQWQLYIPISLPWQISGDKSQVYSVNKQIVYQTEVDQKLPGFRKIFRDNYLQYYKQ